MQSCLHTQAMKTYDRDKVYLHAFLNSERDGGEWSASHSVRFTLKERAPLPILQEAEWASGPI